MITLAGVILSYLKNELAYFKPSRLFEFRQGIGNSGHCIYQGGTRVLILLSNELGNMGQFRGLVFMAGTIHAIFCMKHIP